VVAPPGTVVVQPAPPPSLSVLIPAYNAASTLGEAIESVLTQKPAPLEVVVSDDGSEDDINRVLAAFSHRVRVVRGPNRGLPTARNRAAAAARGELLGLLDADDIWLPGRADALVSAAALRPDLSILTTDAVVVRDGRPQDVTYYGSRDFEVADQVDAILRRNFIFGAGAVRADALRALGGYDPAARWAEDWDLWIRLILRGYSAGLIKAPLYEYRQRAGSLSARTVDLALGVVAVLERAHALVNDPHYLAVLKQTETEWRTAAVWYARATRDPRRRELARAALRAGGQSRLTQARFLLTTVLPARNRST
jgi:glycosyltransferase involved in cell wall biosynthesis